jgi:acyl-CoA synthetase (AMP-forming)/AMP-acid ligase II
MAPSGDRVDGGDRDAMPSDTFWGLIEARAGATPDAIAFEDESDRRVSFGEYRSLAESVAAGLHEQGVRPGMAVSWQLPTTIDTVVLMAALARLSVVQNPIIPILREREVRYILNESRAELFIVRPVWRGFDHGHLARELAAESGFAVLAIDELPAGDPARLPPPPPASALDDGAVRWLFYTSGSTADPKGALHTDASGMAGMNGWLAYVRPRPTDMLPIAFPIAHIGGLSMTAAALTVGYRILLIHTFDPAGSPLLMAERGATLLGSALPFFVAYLAAQRNHGSEPLFPDLRACINGGAPKPPTLHHEVKETLGGLGVVGSWGLTEFPVASSGGFEDTDEQLAATEGRAAPGVDIRVVGLDGVERAAGEEGELRVRGPQMFSGYANPDLDADAVDELGYFRTGDLGVVSETGHVTITGRVKDIIIRNAENISANEIENLLHEHPGVADVAVIGVPDPRTGERVCAVVVPTEDHDVTLGGLRNFCEERGLATQKMPERLELVDEIPRNSMGKAEKVKLRRSFT